MKDIKARDIGTRSATLNLYAHALPDHKRDSMEKMRGFYTGTADTNTDTDDEDIT